MGRIEYAQAQTNRPLVTKRPRNDLGQYDDLVGEWWRPDGAFAALHWLAAARVAMIPQPCRPDELLVDVGCGGGLTAHTTSPYFHVGIDLVASALHAARSHGVCPILADAAHLPLASGCAGVVVAGEVLEHVDDLALVVAEICRVLQPGGTVVIDTINDTKVAKFALVTVAEHLPGGPPLGIHDPDLFVNHKRLQRLFADNGVRLTVWGLRPSARDYARFIFDRRRAVRMVRTKSVALVYQGIGTKPVA